MKGGGGWGGAYTVKKLAARDSHFLLKDFLFKDLSVASEQVSPKATAYDYSSY